ncbi:hypothetical protein [Parvularcula sp. LCG005]|uniref:2-keto-4-pentenoate hydratase n=1 Tax=Parvularcula sp. LCG005 TaxID=3078805 RepID=UPI0029421125|nr:hypothetical protein [Parvularcula sp. LCG005]WOI52401.1 hypothetical protein RUI03_09590 [Parvularcula sp. LCG005]
MSLTATRSANRSIAQAFVDARLQATPLQDYPGTQPTSLDEAYAVQDEAIGLWPDAIGGWKVGRITGDGMAKYGTDRLLGPIFSPLIWQDDGSARTVGMFEGGFAAVEGEYIIEIGADAPTDKVDWTTEEALGMVGAVYAGIEIASSPFPGINIEGPLVTISDFGNNLGLICGPAIPDALSTPLEDWKVKTLIAGSVVGEASAAGIPGGPVESLRYALGNAARRGHPCKKGMKISTGAVTGVHEVKVGQRADVHFPGGIVLSCQFAPVKGN